MNPDHSSLLANVTLSDHDLAKLGVHIPKRVDYEPIGYSEKLKPNQLGQLLATYPPFEEHHWTDDEDVQALIRYDCVHTVHTRE